MVESLLLHIERSHVRWFRHLVTGSGLTDTSVERSFKISNQKDDPKADPGNASKYISLCILLEKLKNEAGRGTCGPPCLDYSPHGPNPDHWKLMYR